MDTIDAGTPLFLSTASFALLILTLAILDLSFSRNMTARIDAVPFLAALVFGVYTIVTLAGGSRDNAVFFALSFALFGFFVVALAPQLRGAIIALSATAAVGGVGCLTALPAANPGFVPAEALLSWRPGLVIAGFLAWALEQARRKTFVLSMELERRATPDVLTGGSNRAHINLLAQNEFARARRYREPYSCLMLEIDGFETLKAALGIHTSDVVVQVLSGYRVVIMRHCDSLGRAWASSVFSTAPGIRKARRADASQPHVRGHRCTQCPSGRKKREFHH